MSAEFVHLHVHSEYSIVDSIVRLPALVEKAAAGGQAAIAVTDQGNLFGLVKFFKAALEAGVKPLVGADVMVSTTHTNTGYARMVLLCKDQTGYLNLKRLITRSYVEGQLNGIPVIAESWLEEPDVAGLIALSGGRDSALAALLGTRSFDEAAGWLERYRSIFLGDFYIELQRTGRAGDEDYVKRAVNLASSAGCPVVATNDVRFLTAEEFEAHEAKTCIQGGYTLDDSSRPRNYSEQQYLRSTEEMSVLFADLPEALQNTVEIARRCNVSLEFGKSYLPEYEIPGGATPDQHLERIAREGLDAKLAGRQQSAEERTVYEQRLARELDVISEMGFPGYFLIVADFISWARNNSVPVGPGRGSGAGSLVAWVIGITDLDPLQFDLLFERFLNPERISMPDFDIDFCMEGRDRVIDYVAGRYGRDRVSQIITYGTMGAKAVIRDVGRVMGHPYGFADRIAKLVPPTPGMTLEKAFEEEPELGQLYANDDEIRVVIDMARQLEGLARNAGTHAGGVVIAPSELTNFAPLYRPDGETTTVTQFDMKDVEAVGLVKFDFLGLRTLTVVEHALNTVNAKRLAEGLDVIDLHTIPMDDNATFRLLRSSHTHAVFQLESRGMRDLIKRLKPDCFDDIVALVALFRPGPLQSGMVDTFIERKHGGSSAPVDYLHPALEPVLANTYGVILYQEQVMQAAQILAGYSLGQADLLRRAMGKKIASEMRKQRNVFVEGAVRNDVDKKIAAHIFGLMEKFAEYGFNKSHSAAYALLAYQTAWLKAHYPADFMASVLSADMEQTDKLKLHLRELKAMGLELLKPDINNSGTTFTVIDNRCISYGLGALKGLGRMAADSIVAERNENGDFRDLFDFCRRIDSQKVNKRAVEALIKAGALDEQGANRPSLLADLPVAMESAEQNARAQEAGQDDMFGTDEPPIPPIHRSSNLARWSPLKLYRYEYESLGLYLSGHPFDQYRDDCPHICTGSIGSVVKSMPRPSASREPRRSGVEVTLAGLITDIRKRGNRVTMFLDDGDDRVELTVYSDAYQSYRHLIEEHAIRVIRGRIRFDDFIDGWRVTVSAVKDIDRVVEQQASQLVIKWLAQESEGLDPAALKNILEPHRPGRCKVSLNYQNADAWVPVPLSDDWRVRPSGELRDKLAEIVGLHAFKFDYEKEHPSH
ncbi:MAG: DNA polymerase III subunit alpha [Gammaproteobacteria bacterium]|nr:DNA polymerase III subunit alpha [Gammaproteobacteria bacterium]MDP6615806.1 DNA polymerase III subunit alpha [Gammaproteobacteria bacterium]MDP6695506.1 DNA polymerase III subunit alpha [Gammaproteobacteria bacterium]